MSAADDRNGKRPEREVSATFEVRKQAKHKAHTELKKLGVPRTSRRHGTGTRYPNTGGTLN